MAVVKLDGLGVALTTPFKKDFSIDYNALDKLLERVTEGGCDYIVVLGTTAETPTLSKEEKLDISRFISSKVAGKLPLVIGIGGNNTSRVIQKIEMLDLKHYDAILSVTPYYNRPTQEGLYQHYKTICDNSPIPLILYNVPTRTGVNISADTVVRLAEYSEKICGIKEASGNISQAENLINRVPAHFSLISGNDGDTCSMMKIGAKGVISVLANAFPRQMKNLVGLCSDHKWEDAQKYQVSLSGIVKAIFEDGSPGGVKSLLAHLGIGENILRLPLVSVNNNVAEKIAKEASLLLQGK